MKFLVHIGYPKSASSWLQSGIFSGRDPQIQPLISEKSIGEYQKSGGRLFFDAGLINTDSFIYPYYAFNPQNAQEQIASGIREQAEYTCLSNEAWAGHPFSGGITSKEYASRIHQVLPKAKILIVIRKQEDMLLSVYAHFLTKAGGLCSLKKFLSCTQHVQIPWHCSTYYRYDLLVEHYYRLFTRQNVLVLPFELLKQNSEKFTSEIYQFLGLKKEKGLVLPPQNVRDYRAYAFLKKNLWVNTLSPPHPANGQAGLGFSRTRQFIIESGKRILTHKSIEKSLCEDQAIIAEYIRPYAIACNKQLQETLPFDLKALGYTFK